jgi:tRNA splicing ligase
MMDSFGMMNSFPNAHGATGKIIKIELPNIIVEGKDDTEKVVSLDNDTKIQNGRDVVAEEDLALDDFVVVIGVPNDKGVIEAKLIRVIPKPEYLQ